MVSHHLLFLIESELGLFLILAHFNAACTMIFSLLLQNFVIKLFYLTFLFCLGARQMWRGGVYRIEKDGGTFLTLLLWINPYFAGIPNIARGSMMSYANDIIMQEII